MIDFKSTLKMAVVSLKINKMRSMLTSLGIIIGVSAVIIMLAVGTGASEKVQKDMESMGSNILTIRSASAKSPYVLRIFLEFFLQHKSAPKAQGAIVLFNFHENLAFGFGCVRI